MRAKNREQEPEQKTLEINVEHKTLEFASVTVGVVGKDSIAITTTVKLPVMTNPRKLQKGDRLIEEAAPLPFVRKRKADETWKTDVAQAARATGKAARGDSKQTTENAAMTMEI